MDAAKILDRVVAGFIGTKHERRSPGTLRSPVRIAQFIIVTVSRGTRQSGRIWVMGQFEFFPVVSRIKKIQTDPLPGFARNYQLSESDRPFALPHGRQAASPASAAGYVGRLRQSAELQQDLAQTGAILKVHFHKFECHSLWPRAAHDGLGLDGAYALRQL